MPAAPATSWTTRYPRALRILHWSLALLFVVQFALILVLRQLESLEFGQIVLGLHRQCGSLVLLLVTIRLALAFRLRPPGSDLPRWQTRVARIVHLAMFAALGAQPVLGILVAWARGDDVGLLGLLKIPPLLSLSTEQGVALETCHRWLAYGLLILLAVHLGAVLFHQIVRKTAVIERMLSEPAPNRLTNRVPVLVQLCCCFGLILSITLGSGIYSAHQYSAFKELRTHFDETEVALLDDMRAAQTTFANARGEAGGTATVPVVVTASREIATAARGFVGRLSDPNARSSARSAASAFAHVATGDQSPKILRAGEDALQSAVDSQYMVVFQGRLEIAQTAAIGHDLIILTLVPTILLSAVLAFLLSRSMLQALTNARNLVRSVEEDEASSGITIAGKGEFSLLMRDIVRMRDAVKTRQQASHAREAEITRANEAREAEVAARAAAREAEIANRNALEQARTVKEIGQGLAALVAGNLKYRIIEPCPGAYDQIRLDFNEAIQRIEAAMEVISDSSGTIGNSSQGVARAASDLAKRTERQAADLSETAWALDQMTDKVKASADGARQVATAVRSARVLASQSDDIVGEAITAMGDIETSSVQIVQIIDAIERIASKSNLLALNARIEAARAGDSGRGFAVVAQEVRLLAQQAGESAKQIRNLVDESTRQVGIGVASVRRTGAALHQVVHEVSGVDTLVAGIASSAREQAIGLEHINQTMEQMDRVVQENAGMVRETTAELQKIRDNAAMLDGLIKQLVVDDGENGELARPGGISSETVSGIEPLRKSA